MARARRAWSDIRDDIRSLLRETTAAASFWSDADLQLYWNLCQDMRAAEMMLAHEGWWKERKSVALVSQQKEYLMEEGTDRIKRIMVVHTAGARIVEQTLVRDERHDAGFVTDTGGGLTGLGTLPTYRLVGDLIYLEPPPAEVANKTLVIELESAPEWIAADGTKPDYRWPSIAETMLILDCAIFALKIENSQGNADPGVQMGLEATRAEMDRTWKKVISTRSYGPTYARRNSMGD